MMDKTEMNSQYSMLENHADNRKLLKNDKCDKYDYLTALACGAIGGIVDIFLVGAPEDSVLGKWTDAQTDKVVMSFAKKMDWKPKAANEGNVNSAIGYLERKFRINYDQRKPGDVGNVFNIAPSTHHMMWVCREISVNVSIPLLGKILYSRK